ncbi:MAG: transaldolase [Deltaproteobacteria bacterium]|nr:transaldolase [Deltaproteobacteria bacterium]
MTHADKIKIFLDTSDKQQMLEFLKNPKVQGFTTNPSLMRKAGVTDYKAFCKDILTNITDKPISFEVFADDFANMARQAKEIATWGKNVYVKIPVTNSKREPAYGLIKELSHSGIKLNVTAVFTVQQTFDVVHAVKGGAPSVVSIFAGRIADAGRDPKPIMTAAREICNLDSNIELLWASSREALNIIEAEQSGCHIITVTPDLVKKTASFGKDLAQFSLETVQMFKNDAEAAGYQL